MALELAETWPVSVGALIAAVLYLGRGTIAAWNRTLRLRHAAPHYQALFRSEMLWDRGVVALGAARRHIDGGGEPDEAWRLRMSSAIADLLLSADDMPAPLRDGVNEYARLLRGAMERPEPETFAAARRQMLALRPQLHLLNRELRMARWLWWLPHYRRISRPVEA